MTKLIARTRGSHPDDAGSVLVVQVGFLFFEPGNLIMERRMLQGIRERAERPRSAGRGGEP
jgi:hypothetical protein